jgi:hypothetical protein
VIPSFEILRFNILLFCGSLFSLAQSHTSTASGLKSGQFNQKKNYIFVINGVASYKVSGFRIYHLNSLTPET